MIEVRHLDKYYAKGSQREVHAVRDTTLQLPDTGMVALFGASGCGKTTLLNIIGGLDRADRGEVLLDGERVTPSATETRNRSIGYIFQNYHLIADQTVFDNVALSLRLCGYTDAAEIETRTMAALEAVDMAMYRRRLPGTLSGGQQQRVAIARALVKNPHLILADEPTGNLDEQNTVMVMELLRQVARDHLVLLVTHEHDLLPYYCDRIIEISDGAVVSSRDNEVLDGYRSKGKSDIYLGDLPHESSEVGTTFVEFFGEEGTAPKSLRLISHGGTLYIAAQEGVRLRVLDASSEIRVHDGSYHPEEQKPVKELPPVLRESPRGKKKKSGRMFGFAGAIVSGFRSHFGRMKRSKKTLIFGLFVFAMSFVFMVANFGTGIRTLQEAMYQYNTDTVYVPAGSLSAEKLGELTTKGLIDSVTFASFRKYGDNDVTVNVYAYQPSWSLDVGGFEVSVPSGDTVASGQLLDFAAIAGKKQFATLPTGKYTELADGEVVISTGYADALLKTSDVSYLRTYDDLMDRTLTRSDGYYGQGGVVYIEDAAVSNYGDSKGNKTLTIVGIVEDKNPCLYVSPVLLTDIFTSSLGLHVAYAPKDVWEALHIAPPSKGTLYARYNGSGNPQSTYQVLGKDYTLDESTLALLEEQELDAEQQAVLANLSEQYYMSREDYIALTAYASVAITSATNPDFTHFALHANDADAFVRYLKGNGIGDDVYTPHDMYLLARGESIGSLVGTLVSAVVFLMLMVLCLFLIMRSGLMASVRQIGILRAIGVSRGNLLFRFFTESLVVFTLTVVPGYLLATASLSWLLNKATAMVSSMLYYPAWLAALTFLFLLCVTAICGTLPIFSLTRKTPSEIIAKYDI